MADRDSAYDVLYRLVENHVEHRAIEDKITQLQARQMELDSEFDHKAARLGGALCDRPVAINYRGENYLVYESGGAIHVERLYGPYDITLPIETDLGPVPADDVVLLDLEVS